MPNYFYFDPTGNRQGPVNDQQLQALANQRIITPETPLETEGGHRGKAGQIPGLFTAQSPMPMTNQTISQNGPGPVASGSKISPWAFIAGALFLVLIGVVAGRMIPPCHSHHKHHDRVIVR